MEILFSNPIWDNPRPQLHAKNSSFPYLCELEDGSILATHQMGEAFESVDGTASISRSTDGGRTWGEPWSLGKKDYPFPVSDCAKITLLPDGRLIAFGYGFIRDDPEQAIANPDNGGVLDDIVFFSISDDKGITWSDRQEIACTWGRHVEAPAPITVLQNGSWVTPITGFPNWEAEMTSRMCGRLLRSDDQGKTWNDDVVCMEFPGDSITCYEQRLCQLSDGTTIIIAWNEDTINEKTLNNHYTISRDNGRTFSKPFDTGINGQTPFVCHLSGSSMFSLHTMRKDTDEPGIYGYLVDFSNGAWNITEEAILWQPQSKLITANDTTAAIFAYLKFGMPGAVKLKDGTLLMAHWLAEEGQYKTIATGIAL
ncbi:MAG: exo-alpha-sialidase [Clostridia bacterium]|jgi:sialidase-1|nr:exo-alpha-sialidase [Clostridia bacterium]